MSDLRIWIFHGVFLLLGGALLLWGEPLAVGWRIFAAGVFYNLALPIYAARVGEIRWVQIWVFLFPLSLLQIFPDWFLVEGLGTLTFPDLTAVRGPPGTSSPGAIPRPSTGGRLSTSKNDALTKRPRIRSGVLRASLTVTL